MVKLIETTYLKDKEPIKTEKEFGSLSQLYKAMDKAPIASAIAYKLRKDKRAEIEYKDGRTIIEIVQKIILTDGNPNE